MRCVKVIRAVCLGGGLDVFPGRTLRVPEEISEKAARLKIAQGFMVECGVPPNPAPAMVAAPESPPPVEEIVTDRDPLPVDPDPRPRPGRGRR